MRIVYRFCALFFGFLGGVFQVGCSVGCPTYGTPPADYTVSGVVVDEEGNPIEGISINISGVYSSDGATESTADGSFLLKVHSEYAGTDLAVRARDVDGDQNGSFADAQKDLVFEYTGGASKDHCGTDDYGNYQAKNVVFVLHQKVVESTDEDTLPAQD